MREQFDQLDFILRFEDGELDEYEIAEGFQHLIDSGVVWQLQGFYGRTAVALIEAGECTDTREPQGPKPEKVGTHCECGAGYVFLERFNAWGYACAR